MSTAGKVLTVLVMLVMVVWLVMLSAVSQLNANWAQKVDAQQKSLDDVTKQFDDARTQGFNLTEQARAKQDEADRDLRVRLIRVAAAERRQSTTTESLTRVKAEVADIQAEAETANKNLATREAEKITNQEGLAKKRDEIDKAKATNAELRTQLAQLQDEFKKILAENAERLAGAAKAGAAKPASSIRQVPSS